MSIALTVLVTIALLLLLLNVLPHEKQITKPIEHRYGARDRRFLTTMGHLLGPPIVPGNEVVALKNGVEIFPAMLEAIREAQHTICFETYIYWSGEIGREFAEALAGRAGQGVKVHVILDWLGSSSMDKAQLDLMRRAGVQIVKYHPIRWYTLTKLNNRTHRKLLITDGRTGFTGGVGIADLWQGDADSPRHWRDTHLRLRGPAVAQMQAAFMDNWMKTNSSVLHGEHYFPAIEPCGSQPAQVVKSSVNEGSESARLMFLLSISAAERSVRIAASYFVPDDLSISTLVAAQQRGVSVEIIVPGRIMDARIVQHASRARWGKLLEAGVKIYEYQPTMFHCKVMVIDEIWSSIGSTNFDNRSFRLNDEANLNVYDPELAAVLIEHFEEDRARSREIRLERWKRRPLRTKTVEHLWALSRTQL